MELSGNSLESIGKQDVGVVPSRKVNPVQDPVAEVKIYGKERFKLPRSRRNKQNQAL
jgi:hypothetical protein